ncbi:Acetyl-coenzyme A carboxylase carboxyl transferase subunit alpha [Sedimentisphaera cyanobacteriorum]|uniref:Acetyl-coenzyme A carboxylase carboxyl transferase subunit alpha n=1 Tax=Sedimentisphaera cyanobacteriorum TaxID=1940790 RepID=A0A1Q2HLY9_9BACT|nr:acetyl-CoA carboxylase carboxyltransferase subunit alpha [Sedimentisphaera cyanobacteriorum]AQQ08468.1 Acetyl-coenzyme A carboxylase carboxyl transferase subunit alpha [Sedimentisphaera cyanobacteriorum]
MTETFKESNYLPFEKEIMEIDKQLHKLKIENAESSEIYSLHKRQVELLQKTYSELSAWQTVQVSRHPNRPILGDYLKDMVKEFSELHGDRCFGDDKAIVTGFGHIGMERVLIVGHKKGRDVKDKVECNFGCANPEGYRKALKNMKLAAKFGIPVVTLIDTPGAYPGIGAEQRGQAQAIAQNLMELARLRTPVISIVIGEGGSGGALGIGVGDSFAMLEYSYYSVISPEGCAAILWRDGSKAEEAAEELKLTADDLKKLGVIQDIIPEPLGGAHRDKYTAVYNVENFILRKLNELKYQNIDQLLEKRYKRITSIGQPSQFSPAGE